MCSWWQSYQIKSLIFIKFALDDFAHTDSLRRCIQFAWLVNQMEFLFSKIF
jgi:hypothetical protein